MKIHFIAATLVMNALCASLASEGADKWVEHSQPIARESDGLGTTSYHPTPTEKQATKDYTKDEFASGSPEKSTLKGKTGRRIAWFGIVRDVHEDRAKNETRIRVEMKYFDGLTDLHQQIVSLYGAGDFEAATPGTGHGIKKLSLVRVYGKVAGETSGIPLVSTQFVRVWDWGLFAFMDYGQDKSDPKWVKLRKVEKLQFYSSRPDEQYYEDRIGSR